LSEKVLRFFEEPLRDRVHIRITCIREFLKLSFLGAIQIARHFHHHADVQITLAIPLQTLDAFALQTENGMRLRSSGDSDVCFASESRNLNFSSERRLHKLHRNITEQIVPIPLKNFVLLNVEHNIKIP